MRRKERSWVDGVNVKDYSHQELNNKGYIPQKTVLFNWKYSLNIEFGEI